MGVEDRCHILMITAGHDDMSDELADVPAIVAASTNPYSSCPSADSLPGPGIASWSWNSVAAAPPTVSQIAPEHVMSWEPQ